MADDLWAPDYNSPAKRKARVEAHVLPRLNEYVACHADENGNVVIEHAWIPRLLSLIDPSPLG